MVGMAGAGIVAIVAAVELLVVASALETASAPVVLLPPPQANNMTTIDKPAADIAAVRTRFNFIKIRSMDVNSTPCH